MIVDTAARSNRNLLKAFYFFFYGANAAVIPFLNLYLARVGLSGTQIGIVSSVFPLVLIVAAPFWGILGDITRRHRRILLLSLLATIPFLITFTFTKNMGPLIVLMIGYALFYAPILPLIDTLSLQMLGDDRNQYGRLRLWGAIGWGVTPPVVGLLSNTLGIRVIFYMYVLLILVGALVVIRIPRFEAEIDKPSFANIKNLMSRPSWLVFLICVFLVGICSHVLEHYFVLYLDNLGGSEITFGFSITMASISEIPIYFLVAWLIKRFGSRGLLLSAFAVYSLRAFLYAQISIPVWAIPAQLMHGPSFSALWAGAVVYAADQAPRGLGATAQSLFNSVFMGVAATAGAFLGGLLYDLLGLAQTFRICGLIAFAGLIIFLLFRGRRNVESGLYSFTKKW